MKKLTRRGFTAAGILAALGLTSGCAFSPSDNSPATLYGPPEYFDNGSSSASSSESYGFDPAENELVEVYGPPEYFGLTPEDVTEEDANVPDDSPIDGVYGPPA